MTERVEVAGGLAAQPAPRPLFADGRREAQLEDGVEGRVAVVQDRAQQPVDLVRSDGIERDPAGEIDVAEVVESEGDGVHLGVAFEQPPIDGLEILVGPTRHEGVHREAVRPHHERADRLELAFTREYDDERARLRLLELQLGRYEGAAQRVLDRRQRFTASGRSSRSVRASA